MLILGFKKNSLLVMEFIIQWSRACMTDCIRSLMHIVMQVIKNDTDKKF